MFKEKLVQLLQQHNITALKLARETGIPKSIIYEWRSGQRMPSAENLSKLSRFFGVSLDELIGGETNIQSSDSNERNLIMLLRAAREVSGDERDAIMDQFQRNMEKYLDEAGDEEKNKDNGDKGRRGKKRTPDKE